MERKLDVLLTVDEFNNLELLKKGLYRVDFRVALNPGPADNATAIGSFVSPQTLISVSRSVVCEGSDEGVEAGGVEESHYVTRSLCCRYVDEDFDVGEGAHFRVPLPAAAAADTDATAAAAAQSLTVRVRLLRADYGIPPPPKAGDKAASGKQAGAAAGGRGPPTSDDPELASARRRLGPFQEVATRDVTVPLVPRSPLVPGGASAAGGRGGGAASHPVLPGSALAAAWKLRHLRDETGGTGTDTTAHASGSEAFPMTAFVQSELFGCAGGSSGGSASGSSTGAASAAPPLHGGLGGLVSAYVPVIFDSMNLACVGISVHACLAGTTFKPDPLAAQVIKAAMTATAVAPNGAGGSSAAAPSKGTAPAASSVVGATGSSSGTAANGAAGNASAATAAVATASAAISRWGTSLSGWLSNVTAGSSADAAPPSAGSSSTTTSGTKVTPLAIGPVAPGSARPSPPPPSGVQRRPSAAMRIAGAADTAVAAGAAPEDVITPEEADACAAPQTLAEHLFPRWRAVRADDRVAAIARKKRSLLLAQAAASAAAANAAGVDGAPATPAPVVNSAATDVPVPSSPQQLLPPLLPEEIQAAHAAVVTPLAQAAAELSLYVRRAEAQLRGGEFATAGSARSASSDAAVAADEDDDAIFGDIAVTASTEEQASPLSTTPASRLAASHAAALFRSSHAEAGVSVHRFWRGVRHMSWCTLHARRSLLSSMLPGSYHPLASIAPGFTLPYYHHPRSPFSPAAGGARPGHVTQLLRARYRLTLSAGGASGSASTFSGFPTVYSASREHHQFAAVAAAAASAFASSALAGTALTPTLPVYDARGTAAGEVTVTSLLSASATAVSPSAAAAASSPVFRDGFGWMLPPGGGDRTSRRLSAPLPAASPATSIASAPSAASALEPVDFDPLSTSSPPPVAASPAAVGAASSLSPPTLAFGLPAADAPHATTYPCFAYRLHAAARSSPEAVGAAIAADAAALAAHINTLQRKLQRLMAVNRRVILGPLQATYRAASVADALALLPTRIYPGICLLDPDAAAPLTIFRSARRGVLVSLSAGKGGAAASGHASASSAAAVAAAPVAASTTAAGGHAASAAPLPPMGPSRTHVASALRRDSTARTASNAGTGDRSRSGSTVGDSKSPAAASASVPTVATGTGTSSEDASAGLLHSLIAGDTLSSAIARVELAPVDPVVASVPALVAVTVYRYAQDEDSQKAAALVMAAASASSGTTAATGAAADAGRARSGYGTITAAPAGTFSDDDDEDDDEEEGGAATGAAVGFSPAGHRSSKGGARRKSAGARAADAAGPTTTFDTGAKPAPDGKTELDDATGVLPAVDSDVDHDEYIGKVQVPSASSTESPTAAAPDDAPLAARPLAPTRTPASSAVVAAAGVGDATPASFASGSQGGPTPLPLASAAAPATVPPSTPLAPAVPPTGAHVVIFLNGLGGTQHDTRLIRSHLKLHHPHLFCYVTTSNQLKNTEGHIVEAAARVAREIHEYLGYKLPVDEGHELGRLSIVAFSLGGVVARLALRHPLLRPYLPKCHAFLSVASPHLGLLYSTSSVVSLGVFLFRQFRGSQALAQLSYNDEPAADGNIRGSLLYLLACGWEAPSASHGTGGAPASALSSAAASAGPAKRALFEPSTAAGSAGSKAPPSGTSTSSTTATGTSSSIEILLGADDDDDGLDRSPMSTVEGDAVAAISDSDAASAALSLASRATTAVEDAAGAAALRIFEGERIASAASTSGVAGADTRGSPVETEVRHGHHAAGDADATARSRPATAGASRGAAMMTPTAINKTVLRLLQHGFASGSNGSAVLAHFKHVIMLASEQDAYAPASSCHAQWCDSALADEKHGPAYGEMLRGFFDGVSCERVTRWDVHFKDLSSILAGRISIDSMLGREAHVAFLETEQLSALIALGLEPVWDTSCHY